MNNWNPLSNNYLRILAVLLGLSTYQTHAQSVSSPPDQSVRPLPENSEWTIAVKALEPDKTNPGAQLKEIRGQRTASLRQDIYDYGDSTTERWIAGNFLLETFSGQNSVVPTPYPKNSPKLKTLLSSFPELDWVSPAHYQGIEVRDKVECRFYKRTIVVKPEIDGEIRSAVAAGKIEMPADIIYSYKAWIDPETNWPVAFEGLGFHYDYKISVPENKITLSLPNRFLQAARQIDPNFSP